MAPSQGRAADAAGIQFRELNAARGPAVRGPRAQQDRELYKAEVQRLLAATPGLEVADGAVTDLVVERDGGGPRAAGVVLATGVLAHARVQMQGFGGLNGRRWHAAEVMGVLIAIAWRTWSLSASCELLNATEIPH